MSSEPTLPEILSPESTAFYRRSIQLLQTADIPFLIGGAFALAHYTGVVRHTKDLDVFVRRADCARALALFVEAGYSSELTFPHWLGKVFCGDLFVDLIFSSGNGLANVDDLWFEHSEEAEVLGQRIRLCPPEEMIWSKGYILERERYDGADIFHLLQACGPRLDWPRLLERFGPYWRVLLSHLVLFGFVYPSERSQVPEGVLLELLDRLQSETREPPPVDAPCQGTLLSREQYLVDVKQWGYRDARLAPEGVMSARDIRHWTAAINGQK